MRRPLLLPRVLCLVAVTLLAGSAVRAQTAGKSPDELFEKAVALHQAGDILGAIQYYEALLQQQPDRVEARSNLGAAYMKLGRYEAAVEQYRKALALKPDLPEVRMNLGLAFYKADRINEAAPEFEAVRKARPDNRAATLLLADCLLRMGKTQRVVELLDPLQTQLGGDRLFAYLLGTALLNLNQVERGQRVIDRLFREGESAEAHLLMGSALLQGGNQLKALPELKRAIEMNPKLPGAHALYARALKIDRDQEGAVREYLKELENNPNDFESNLWLGLLRLDENRLDEAGEYLKRAGRLRPQDASVAYGLGRAHLAAGRLEEARQSFELLVAQAPDYQQGHVLLATVYYRLGKRELGDAQKAIVDRLRAEAKAKGAAEQVDVGPGPVGGPPAKDPPPPSP